MILSEIKLHQVRNLINYTLDLHPQCTLITGPNGAGKTAILESLYMLSRGYSFKSREIQPLINHQTDTLTIFARSIDGQTISIQKSTASPTIIKLNSQTCLNTSELAYALPCQVFYQDIFDIIDSGSSVRRRTLPGIQSCCRGDAPLFGNHPHHRFGRR